MLVCSALEEVTVEYPAIVQRGGVVQRRPSLLVLCAGGDAVLLGDDLDDLGLVEEDCLVQRGGAVLVAAQGEALGSQQLLNHRDHARRHSIVQDGDGVLSGQGRERK